MAECLLATQLRTSVTYIYKEKRTTFNRDFNKHFYQLSRFTSLDFKTKIIFDNVIVPLSDCIREQIVTPRSIISTINGHICVKTLKIDQVYGRIYDIEKGENLVVLDLK